MSSQHLSWVFWWCSSLAVALNFVENRTQGAWRRSILCDVLVFTFIFMKYINLGVKRCIQSLIKHRRHGFFVKGVNGSCLLTVFAKNFFLGCLGSECAFGGILNYFKLFSRFEELILTCTQRIFFILFYGFFIFILRKFIVLFIL